MTETQESELVRDFPFKRQCPFSPPEEYSAIRDKGHPEKVRLYNGSFSWLICGYADAKSLLSDKRLSADRRADGFPLLGPSAEVAKNYPPSLITMDDPEHAVRRRLLMGDFTLYKMKSLRPRIQKIADNLIDAMLAGESPVDLMSVYSLPLSSLTISHLLGVPYSDHEYFERQSQQMVKADSLEGAMGAIMELSGYMARLVEDKEKHPGDDLLSRLVTNPAVTEVIPRDEMLSLGLLLLGAGHAASAAMITMGTAVLLQHHDQLAKLREDATLVPGAVEELLRFLSVTDIATARVATADVEVGDQVIRAGEGVVISEAAVNRDESVFPAGDKLDISRPAQTQLAFGYGPHQCLGANLARTELEVAYETLFRRIPTLRLANASEDLQQTPGSELPDLKRLRVTW